MQSLAKQTSTLMERFTGMKLTPSNMSLFCSTCQVQVSSESVMKVHVSGKKHRQLEQIRQKQESMADRSIYVRGFPLRSSVEQLQGFFETFGEINKVILDKEHGLYAIIEFADVDTAKSLLSKTHLFMNKSKLSIRPRQVKVFQPKRKTQSELGKMEEISQSLTTNPPVIDFEEIRKKLTNCTNLKDEMVLLMTETELSADEIIVRKAILEELELTLQTHLQKDCSIQLFGSSVNGLGTRGCDLDLFFHLKSGESNQLVSAFESSSIESINQTGEESVSIKSMTMSVTEVKEAEDGHCSERSIVENCGDEHTVTTEQQRLSELKLINQISCLLRSKPNIYGHIVKVTSARCPVVKFVYLPSGHKCDLSINNRLALRNTSLIQFLLTSDERIRPLIYSIRQWAKVQGIAGQTNTGSKPTSYALTMLVFFYLQNLSPPLLPTVEKLSQMAEDQCAIDGWDCSFTTNGTKLPNENRLDLEELLLGFFQFFVDLGFDQKVFSIRSGKVIDLHSFSEKMRTEPCLNGFKISPVLVQDPFVSNHNITSNISEKSRTAIEKEFTRALKQCCHGSNSTSQRFSLVHLLSTDTTTPNNQESLAGDESGLDMSSVRDEENGTNQKSHSFVISIDSSKIMAEALRCNLKFAEVQDIWCRNAVRVVKEALKLFDICSTTVEQKEVKVVNEVTKDKKENTVNQNCNKTNEQLLDAVVHEIGSNCNGFDLDIKMCESGSLTEVNQEESLLKELASRKRCSSEDDSNPCKRSKFCSLDSNGAESVTLDSKSVENNSLAEAKTIVETYCCEETSQKQVTSAVYSAHCSTYSRLWVGRKKVRKQCSLVQEEYEKEAEVSRILMSASKLSDDGKPVLSFCLTLSTEKSPSTLVTITMEPSAETAKEFSCFLFCFRSVAEKLTDKYGMDKDREWKTKDYLPETKPKIEQDVNSQLQMTKNN